MAKIENPDPSIQEQWGICAQCDGRVQLKNMIDHLVSNHGAKAEDLSIEVSDTPFSDD